MANRYTDYGFNDVTMSAFAPYSFNNAMMPALPKSSNPIQPINSKIKNISELKNSIFTDPNQGFMLGNMEVGTYEPYKNYSPIMPSIISEQQRDLYKIQEMSFAAHDINLFLDTHPNDQNLIGLYNEYNKKAEELENAYERKYGPINLNDIIGLDMMSWAWIKEPWPWSK